MKTTYLIIIFSFIYLSFSCNKEDTPISILNSNLQFKWTKALQGPSEEDEIDAVASDQNGNVFVSGKFENELTIDGQSTTIISNGMADIMVVKYDKDGNWKWTRNFGSTGEDNVFDADCDNEGNLILSGYFQETVAFGDYPLTALGGTDMMILKINPEGTVLWAKRYGGSEHDGGNEIVISNDNKIIVGAESVGTFEGIPNTGGQDAYILSLDNNGNTQWIQAVKGIGDARAKAVEVDNLGNVYLGGDYREENYIDNNGANYSFENFGGRDAYLVSFTASGDYRWINNWGNIGVDFCKGIVTTSQNELYAVGQFQKTVDFNGTLLNSTNDTKDLFVWKIDNTGKTKWLRQISSSNEIAGTEVALDDSDNLIFGLGIPGTVDFQINETDFKSIYSCGGARCPILVEYSSNGELSNYLLANESYDGFFGEIAVSNNTAYVDCEALGGSYTFGSTEIETINQSKDAILVAIELK